MKLVAAFVYVGAHLHHFLFPQSRTCWQMDAFLICSVALSQPPYSTSVTCSTVFHQQKSMCICLSTYVACWKNTWNYVLYKYHQGVKTSRKKSSSLLFLLFFTILFNYYYVLLLLNPVRDRHHGCLVACIYQLFSYTSCFILVVPMSSQVSMPANVLHLCLFVWAFRVYRLLFVVWFLPFSTFLVSQPGKLDHFAWAGCLYWPLSLLNNA